MVPPDGDSTVSFPESTAAVPAKESIFWTAVKFSP